MVKRFSVLKGLNARTRDVKTRFMSLGLDLAICFACAVPEILCRVGESLVLVGSHRVLRDTSKASWTFP